MTGPGGDPFDTEPELAHLRGCLGAGVALFLAAVVVAGAAALVGRFG